MTVLDTVSIYYYTSENYDENEPKNKIYKNNQNQNSQMTENNEMLKIFFP
jgi:hypothetical protein